MHLHPIVGHVTLTFMILADGMTTFSKVVWLIAVWVFWFGGSFIYLLPARRAEAQPTAVITDRVTG